MALRILWRVFIGGLLILLACPMVKSYYFLSGLRWQYIFLFSFLSAYSLTPLCRRLALRLNLVDKPDWRKIHNRPTPLLGGMAVYTGFCASLLFNGVFLPGMKVLLLGSTLIFAMGLWDDIRPLPAVLKLMIQTLISLGVVFLGGIHLTFFYHTSWAPVLNVPLTVLWIVGLTNAMNFFDGIDGLAAGLSAMAAFFLSVIAFKTNQPVLGWFAVALLGACVGFLPYNFRFRESALLFLGDAGSTSLGFTLAGLAVLGQWSEGNPFVTLAAPVLVFGVLIFDMIYVNLSRLKNRQARNILELLTAVNKDHLHHRLLFMGFARKEAAFVIFTMSASLGVSALIIMNQRPLEALLGLFQAVLILGLIMALMVKGKERIPKEGDRRIWRRRHNDRLADENFSGSSDLTQEIPPGDR